jgi:hypothetical protein
MPTFSTVDSVSAHLVDTPAFEAAARRLRCRTGEERWAELASQARERIDAGWVDRTAQGQEWVR